MADAPLAAYTRAHEAALDGIWSDTSSVHWSAPAESERTPTARLQTGAGGQEVRATKRDSEDGGSAGDRLLLESRRRALGELRRLQAGGEQSFEYSSESDVPLSESKKQRRGRNLEDSLDSLDTLDRALAVSLRLVLCGCEFVADSRICAFLLSATNSL